MTPPVPPVDPTSAGDVAAVVEAVVASMGNDGVVDLLARLPGVRVEPATPKRFLAAARPARVWIGPEDHLVLGAELVRVQVVGGVELHRQPLRRGDLADTVAGLVVRLTHEEGSRAETSAVLTAAREATSAF